MRPQHAVATASRFLFGASLQRNSLEPQGPGTEAAEGWFTHVASMQSHVTDITWQSHALLPTNKNMCFGRSCLALQASPLASKSHGQKERGAGCRCHCRGMGFI